MKGAALGPRRCYLQPVPEIEAAAQLLSKAVQHHRQGDRARAAECLAESDCEEIGVWFRTIVGSWKPDLHGVRPEVLSPPALSLKDRLKPRMPTAETKLRVLLRDGMHCRFCDAPVIPKHVILAASTEYPEHARWSDVANEQHRMFQAMTLQYDHLLPHSRGGDSSLDNIVITCAACNYGRISWTLEEARLTDPRTQPIRKSSWDGMMGFL